MNKLCIYTLFIVSALLAACNGDTNSFFGPNEDGKTNANNGVLTAYDSVLYFDDASNLLPVSQRLIQQHTLDVAQSFKNDMTVTLYREAPFKLTSLKDGTIDPVHSTRALTKMGSFDSDSQLMQVYSWEWKNASLVNSESKKRQIFVVGRPTLEKQLPQSTSVQYQVKFFLEGAKVVAGQLQNATRRSTTTGSPNENINLNFDFANKRITGTIELNLFNKASHIAINNGIIKKDGSFTAEVDVPAEKFHAKLYGRLYGATADVFGGIVMPTKTDEARWFGHFVGKK